MWYARRRMSKAPSKSEISAAAAAMGRKGGKAGKGAAKARPSEVARKAALARWGKRKGEGESGVI